MTAVPTSRTGRLEGIDLARAVAMIGMLMVHVGPTGGDDPLGRLYALPHGHASVLFMLVAGVGVSLLAGSPQATVAGTAAQLAWRALLLLPLGLALQSLDDGRLVILQTYALMFLLAIGAHRLPDRVLLCVVGVMAVGGPIGYLYGKLLDPVTFSRVGIGLDQSPGGILHGLVLSGPYPLITWIVPFALGLWLGRHDLHAQPIRSRMVLAGCGVAIATAVTAGALQAWWREPRVQPGWDQLILMEPHSQMPLWLAGSTASAVAVLGLTLMIADRGGHRLWPLVATGQAALTFYVGHLIALALWPRTLTAEQPLQALGITLAFTAAFAALMVGWRRLHARGPLEILLQLPRNVAQRWRSLH